MKRYTTLLLGILVLSLSGCSLMEPRSMPAPVRDAGSAPLGKAPAPKPGVAPARQAQAAPRQIAAPADPGAAQTHAYRPSEAGVAVPLAAQPQPLPAEPQPLEALPLETDEPPPQAKAQPEGRAEPLPKLASLDSTQAARPTQALLKQADAQRAAGDLPGAASTLERALRIEPRNPHLWNRLAQVRLEQGQYEQAATLAAKSDALGGGAPGLARDNQRILRLAGRRGG